MLGAPLRDRFRNEESCSSIQRIAKLKRQWAGLRKSTVFDSGLLNLQYLLVMNLFLQQENLVRPVTYHIQKYTTAPRTNSVVFL